MSTMMDDSTASISPFSALLLSIAAIFESLAAACIADQRDAAPIHKNCVDALPAENFCSLERGEYLQEDDLKRHRNTRAPAPDRSLQRGDHLCAGQRSDGSIGDQACPHLRQRSAGLHWR